MFASVYACVSAFSFMFVSHALPHFSHALLRGAFAMIGTIHDTVTIPLLTMSVRVIVVVFVMRNFMVFMIIHAFAKDFENGV